MIQLVSADPCGTVHSATLSHTSVLKVKEKYKLEETPTPKRDRRDGEGRNAWRERIKGGME